jgi:phosphatidylinositol 3-kinase
MWAVVDPDIPRENPVEDKHRRLVRSHRSSPYDRELKPNTKLRDELGVRIASSIGCRQLSGSIFQVILNYPPIQVLTSEEKDLVWKYRFYLARDRRGLTKFVKSVTWRDPMEVKQAVEELLPMWTEIDTDDALELLGPGIVDSRVRAFAVRQLARADDDVRAQSCAANVHPGLFRLGTYAVSFTTGPIPQVRELC